MLGDKVTMGQSLMVTAFSMVTVFLALLIISYLIKGLQSFSGKNKDEETANNIEPIKTKQNQEIIEKDEDPNDEELVAAIAAAIAANMNVDVSNIKINSIRRVAQSTPIWSKVGREEQIFNRL